jgi:hypothetical protein
MVMAGQQQFVFSAVVAGLLFTSVFVSLIYSLDLMYLGGSTCEKDPTILCSRIVVVTKKTRF